MYHRHLEALMPEVPVYIENATRAEETNSDSVSSALLLCASFFFKDAAFYYCKQPQKPRYKKYMVFFSPTFSVEYCIFLRQAKYCRDVKKM